MTTLLQTKLHIPTLRPNAVPRTKLISKLYRGYEKGRRITLVSAPAGFGKTTTIAEWIYDLRLGVDSAVNRESQIINLKSAWLSLDAEDNDPARFLAYFVAALQTVDEAIGSGVPTSFHSPGNVDWESLLVGVLNGVTAVSDTLDPIFLILDDIHLIENQIVEQALAFLVENLPPNLHLVLISRTDPPLPLSRLRARGILTEVRAHNLRFSPQEAYAFLHDVIGIDLGPDMISALNFRTEGWVAGLQMAGLSLQNFTENRDFIQNFTGSHRYVMDYLIDEVFTQQPTHIQEFLLNTAVLDRMCASLCERLSPQSSQTILEQLDSANLFIVPLDEERRWFRYHHLFADLLRQRLQQVHPERIRPLHEQASRWFAENNYPDEAIDHALKSMNVEQAADLINQHAETAWVKGEMGKVLRWLDALPEEQKRPFPHLFIFQAWALVVIGHHQKAAAMLDIADEAVTKVPPASQEPIRGRIAAARAYVAIFAGDQAAIIPFAEQALASLPAADATWRCIAATALGDAYSLFGKADAALQTLSDALKAGYQAENVYLTLLAGFKLTAILRQKCLLQQAFATSEELLTLAERTNMDHTSMVGVLNSLQGEILSEWNRIDEALPLVNKGVEITIEGKNLGMLGWSHLIKARVLLTQRDWEGIQAIINKFEQMTKKTDVPPWIMIPVKAFQGYLYLVQGDLNRAIKWAQQRNLNADAPFNPLRESEYGVLVKLLLAQQKFDDAEKIINELLNLTRTGNKTSDIISALLLLIELRHLQNQPDAAAAALNEALTLAEPGGLVRTFVDNGRFLLPLLQQINPQTSQTSQILTAFNQDKPLPQSAIPSSSPHLVTPLTAREIKVLRLIAAGLKNKEIAAELTISLNTIYYHTKNIYSKLQVNTRLQAAAKAKELGII
ncbi:MAG: hypothetical protein DWQ04_33180 [Chloroflexi bacterium]|nr:MAG: hypothetical protein DWQ04_33180 [Chloroflexota bacterium]